MAHYKNQQWKIVVGHANVNTLPGMWGRAWSLVALLLKVSLSRKVILVPWVLQKKTELENVNFCPSLLERKFFDRFFGELKKTKSAFEINWPLEPKGKFVLKIEA